MFAIVCSSNEWWILNRYDWEKVVKHLFQGEKPNGTHVHRLESIASAAGRLSRSDAFDSYDRKHLREFRNEMRALARGIELTLYL